MFMGQETVVKRRTNELRIKHQFGFDHMLVSAKHVSLLIRLIQPKYFLNTAICGEHQSAHESTSGDGKRLGIPLNPVTSYLPKTKDCRLIQRVCETKTVSRWSCTREWEHAGGRCWKCTAVHKRHSVMDEVPSGCPLIDVNF